MAHTKKPKKPKISSPARTVSAAAVAHTPHRGQETGFEISGLDLPLAPELGVTPTGSSSDEADAPAVSVALPYRDTDFFRDTKLLDALTRRVFPDILDGLNPGEPIRLWVPGCGSGEDAYSLAIALVELLEENARRTRIQIFATDRSAHNIKRVRAGIYPEASVLRIDPARVQRFFTQVGGGYQVTRDIRDLCVFARHDFTTEIPFSKLDLVSCRVSLTHFGPALRRRVMSVFAYALKPGGYLLLAKAEKPGIYSELFDIDDGRLGVYTLKESYSRDELADLFAVGAQPPVRRTNIRTEPGRSADLRREAERILLDRFTPPGFLVDGNLQILHFQGDVSAYLKPGTGEPDFDLVNMLRPDLVLDAREAVLEARQRSAPVRRPNVKFDHDGRLVDISIEAIPVRGMNGDATDFMLLVVDQTAVAGAGPESAHRPVPAVADDVLRARNELEATREYLRSLVHNYKAANEELRVANEELLCANEELQNTNESFETAKMELVSANEELTVLNHEIEKRNAEIGRVASDLHHLLVGVEIPILLLRADTRIRLYTPAARRLWNLLPADIGRPITDIKSKLNLPDPDRLFERALQSKIPTQIEVRDREGRWYALRLRPYSAANGEPDSLLVAVVDIDMAKRASAAIVDQIREPLVVVDAQHRIVTANPAFYASFRLEPDEGEGRPFFQVGGGMFDFERMRELVETVLAGETVEDFIIEHAFHRIGMRTLSVNARALSHNHESPQTLLITIDDLTERMTAAQYKEAADRWMWHTFEDSVVPTCVLTPDRRFTRVNRAFCRFSGYSRTALMGKDVTYNCFPDDRALIRQHFEETIAADSVHYEQRFRHKNGSELWGFVAATAVKDDSGASLYIFGQIVDITERKQFEQRLAEREETLVAQQAKLRALAGRLIHEREEAFRAVAREAHDTFAQDVVGTSMKLAALQDNMTGASVAARRSLAARVKETRELAKRIHNFARRMHPSQLEELGLASAIRMEIERFSQHAISIKLHEKGSPRAIPKEIALTVYRVCQESLQNTVRHARARSVTITLTTTPAEVAMTIRDNGQGFDLTRPRRKPGLGLVAMEERVRQVNGAFEITSAPGKGTQVEVHIPLK